MRVSPRARLSQESEANGFKFEHKSAGACGEVTTAVSRHGHLEKGRERTGLL